MQHSAPTSTLSSSSSANCRTDAWSHVDHTAGIDTSGDVAEPNPFAEGWMLDSALEHVGDAANLHSITPTDARGAVVARFILRPGQRLGRLPLPCAAVWSHPNGFLSSAWAAAGYEAQAWRAVLTDPAIAADHRALIVEGLVEGGALHQGLAQSAKALGVPLAIESRTSRAMLAATDDIAAYWDAAVSPKKRKELRRQWARLAELGTADVGRGDAAGDWIEEFLLLESTGWKGRAGSALASRAETAAFFRHAMRAGLQQGKILATILRLDDRPIAMLITLMTGGAGFSFKTAFDETYARFSPGVLLQRESLALLAEYNLDWIDSCASQDHPMIDSLWRQRRSVVTVSLPFPGTVNRLAWQATHAAMAGWHRVKRPRDRSWTAA